MGMRDSLVVFVHFQFSLQSNLIIFVIAKRTKKLFVICDL